MESGGTMSEYKMISMEDAKKMMEQAGNVIVDVDY